MTPFRWLASRVAVFLHASQQFVDELVRIGRGLWQHPHPPVALIAIFGYPVDVLSFQTAAFLLLVAIYGAVIQEVGR